jgi:hypothetical protein
MHTYGWTDRHDKNSIHFSKFFKRANNGGELVDIKITD